MNTTTLAERLQRARSEDFRVAAANIASDAIRTPLLPFTSNERTLRLKAENLQPIGSFKIRSGANAIACASGDVRELGVATASAGNFAQGLASAGRRRGIRITVHAPDTAAAVKIDAIRRLGGEVVTHDFAGWWSVMSSRETGRRDGVFIHPVAEPAVVIGNGTIGLELAEDWPELDTVVVPVGGGGLLCGIALALRSIGHRARIVACEVETSTPLAAAFAAGHPVRVERHPSFVDGIGSYSVLEEMWPLLRELVDEVITVSTAAAKEALRTLAMRSHLVVEGAAAVALAAAQSERCGGRNVAVILSGGNIDPGQLAAILSEQR